MVWRITICAIFSTKCSSLVLVAPVFSLIMYKLLYTNILLNNSYAVATRGHETLCICFLHWKNIFFKFAIVSSLRLCYIFLLLLRLYVNVPPRISCFINLWWVCSIVSWIYFFVEPNWILQGGILIRKRWDADRESATPLYELAGRWFCFSSFLIS
jgi:hypothetical protein